jgi:hypothetical protein
VYTISIAGLRLPVYAAVSALIVNLVSCVVLTLLFRALGISAGRDATRPADFEANPVLGSPTTALLAQISQNAHVDNIAEKNQESVIRYSERIHTYRDPSGKAPVIHPGDEPPLL